MTTANRFIRLILILSLLSIAAIVVRPSLSISAQTSEPTAIIDAALKDLSQKLGKPLSRSNVDTWSWEQLDYPDASLGCPQPGQTYAQVVTRAYHFVFKVNGVDYDYRATNDGKSVFQCGGSGGAAPASAPTPTIAPPPTTAPVAPPDASAVQNIRNPLAFIGSDGNIMTAVTLAVDRVTNDGSPQPSSSELTHYYGSPQWSPDGSKLAYNDVRQQTLFVAVSGRAPIAVARGIMSLFAGAWSPDGNEIAYAVFTGQTQGTNGSVYQIQAIPVTDAGAGQPHYAGTFVVNVGCGGGGWGPDETAYMAEAGYYGNGQTLAWIPQGFVYSLDCLGNGLSLVNASGQVLWTVPNVYRAAISPDRTRAVAIKMDAPQGAPTSIVLIDLSNGSVTPLQSEAMPDQLAWSPDGTTIFYSTVIQRASVQGTANAAVGQQVFGDWPREGRSYEVSLWRMPAAGGPSTRLTQQEGRAIGVIAPSPDNSSVVYSFIPSLAQLIQAINSGKSLAEVTSLIPRAQIFFVQANGSAPAAKMMDGGHPAFSKAVAFSTASAGGQPASQPTLATNPGSNVAPPNLVIGGKAVVTLAQGDTLNMRRTPSRSAPVLRILKPGAVVTIQAGPQMAEGLRWWQIQADDGSVGWVVDQVTDDKGTENMLAPQ